MGDQVSCPECGTTQVLRAPPREPDWGLWRYCVALSVPWWPSFVGLATTTQLGAIVALSACGAPVVSFIAGGVFSDRLKGAEERSAGRSILQFLSTWLLTNVVMAIALVLIVLATQKTVFW